MNVEIEAGGRRVKIDCSDTNTSYREIADKALEVWAGTDGAKEPSDGPASFGISMERTRDRDPSSTMRVPVDVPQ